MAEFRVKTKGNANPHGKARVYFTCHPDDFERYFQRITDDILSANNCAVYYTQDMSAKIAENEKETDLGGCALFVVPITIKLMTTPNRAMDEDIAYAKKHNIPILPFMMEMEIVDIYSQQENFGERQFLNPYSVDNTEISYAEKLKKYLDALLISEETAKRIRAAFDAYVFLSYRKKDRAYANELMKLIHDIPAYRDIAVWYDEFLTPGESFEQNIKKALNDSALFALLVTPSVLEEKNGKPNFVMGEEYPAAKKAKKQVVPVLMQKTDENELKKKFVGLPTPIAPNDKDFQEVLTKALVGVALQSNADEPEHTFLIGLAYLDGIDVEVNVKRALELITSSAEKGLIEAMQTLQDMYHDGKRVPLDYKEAAKWAQRRVEACEKKYGKKDKNTLSAYRELGHLYDKLGDYQKAHEIHAEVYKRTKRLFGKMDFDDIAAMGSLAYSYGQIGEWSKALELTVETYEKAHKYLGSRHPYSIHLLLNAGYAFSQKGRHKYAYNILALAFKKCYLEFGEDDELTFQAAKSIAYAYKNLGKTKDAIESFEAIYEQSCVLYGKEHPSTLTTLNDLALLYSEQGDYERALDLYQKSVDTLSETLGEVHPHTLTVWGNIVSIYGKMGELEEARDMEEKLYALHCNTLGENHPRTHIALNNLCTTYYNLGDYISAYDGIERLHKAYLKTYGKMHEKTKETASLLSHIKAKMDE